MRSRCSISLRSTYACSSERVCVKKCGLDWLRLQAAMACMPQRHTRGLQPPPAWFHTAAPTLPHILATTLLSHAAVHRCAAAAAPVAPAAAWRTPPAWSAPQRTAPPAARWPPGVVKGRCVQAAAVSRSGSRQAATAAGTATHLAAAVTAMCTVASRYCQKKQKRYVSPCRRTRRCMHCSTHRGGPQGGVVGGHVAPAQQVVPLVGRHLKGGAMMGTSEADLAQTEAPQRRWHAADALRCALSNRALQRTPAPTPSAAPGG